jgi:uncharacterized protein YaaW (UPF0174 family)
MDYSLNTIQQLMLKIQELTEDLEVAEEILESILKTMINILLEEEKKKWIQKAIKKEGALHKSLKVGKDKKIPLAKLEKASHKGGKMGKRARLALTLRKMKHGKKNEESK